MNYLRISIIIASKGLINWKAQESRIEFGKQVKGKVIGRMISWGKVLGAKPGDLCLIVKTPLGRKVI